MGKLLDIALKAARPAEEIAAERTAEKIAAERAAEERARDEANAVKETPLEPAPQGVIIPQDVIVPQNAAKPYKIGDFIADKGIFAGLWKTGRFVRDNYIVFAAPEDLQNQNGKRNYQNFNETTLRVGMLRDWHGHDGVYYPTPRALYRALRRDRYNGEWFVPTIELVWGSTLQGGNVFSTSLCKIKDRGAFTGSFAGVDPGYYWAVISELFGFRARACAVGLWHQAIAIYNINSRKFACRPYRAEKITAQEAALYRSQSLG